MKISYINISLLALYPVAHADTLKLYDSIRERDQTGLIRATLCWARTSALSIEETSSPLPTSTDTFDIATARVCKQDL